jgi:hypothetical protein
MNIHSNPNPLAKIQGPRILKDFTRGECYSHMCLAFVATLIQEFFLISGIIPDPESSYFSSWWGRQRSQHKLSSLECYRQEEHSEREGSE